MTSYQQIIPIYFSVFDWPWGLFEPLFLDCVAKVLSKRGHRNYKQKPHGFTLSNCNIFNKKLIF